MKTAEQFLRDLFESDREDPDYYEKHPQYEGQHEVGAKPWWPPLSTVWRRQGAPPKWDTNTAWPEAWAFLQQHYADYTARPQRIGPHEQRHLLLGDCGQKKIGCALCRVADDGARVLNLDRARAAWAAHGSELLERWTERFPCFAQCIFDDDAELPDDPPAAAASLRRFEQVLDGLDVFFTHP